MCNEKLNSLWGVLKKSPSWSTQLFSLRKKTNSYDITNQNKKPKRPKKSTKTGVTFEGPSAVADKAYSPKAVTVPKTNAANQFNIAFRKAKEIQRGTGFGYSASIGHTCDNPKPALRSKCRKKEGFGGDSKFG